MKQDVLYPVQYLRAVAALAVFYFHLSEAFKNHSSSNGVPIEQIGAAGVDLFFVISGFIMAMIVWNRPTTFSGFLKDRLIRIVPLYWMLTLVVFAIAVFAPTLLGSTKADLLQLFHSLVFVPYGVNESSSVPTLVVGWTLNYEMFFYCIIACFAGFAKDRWLIATSTFICGASLAGFFIQPSNGYVAFYLDPIILEFPMGILVFHYWRLTSNKQNKFFSGALFVASIIAIALLFNKDPGQYRFIYWGIPAALLLYAALNVITFKSEGLRLLGNWSYSIYLLHVFLIMGFHKVLVPTLPTMTIPWFLMVATVTVSLIAVSAISFYVFERPVTRWLKSKLFSGKQPT